jgi:hypothetical protein
MALTAGHLFNDGGLGHHDLSPTALTMWAGDAAPMNTTPAEGQSDGDAPGGDAGGPAAGTNTDARSIECFPFVGL